MLKRSNHKSTAKHSSDNKFDGGRHRIPRYDELAAIVAGRNCNRHLLDRLRERAYLHGDARQVVAGIVIGAPLPGLFVDDRPSCWLTTLSPIAVGACAMIAG